MTAPPDAIRDALEAAATWAEAKTLLRERLLEDGVQADDALVTDMLMAGCGGDVVAVDTDGVPVHPLARKFMNDDSPPPEQTQPSLRRARP